MARVVRGSWWFLVVRGAEVVCRADLRNLDESRGGGVVAVSNAGLALVGAHAAFQQGDDGATAGVGGTVDGSGAVRVKTVEAQRGVADLAGVDVDPVNIHGGVLLRGYLAGAQCGEDEVHFAGFDAGQWQRSRAGNGSCGADGVVLASNALAGDGGPAELGESGAVLRDRHAGLSVSAEEAHHAQQGGANLLRQLRVVGEGFDLVEHERCRATQLVNRALDGNLGTCGGGDDDSRHSQCTGSANGGDHSGGTTGDSHGGAFREKCVSGNDAPPKGTVSWTVKNGGKRQ